MKQENRTFLDQHRGIYNTLVQAEYIPNLDYGVKEGFVRVIGEEFSPGYRANLWCGPCIADMIRFAYVQYDKWLAVKAKMQTDEGAPKHVEESFIELKDKMFQHHLSAVLPDEPFIKHETFPKVDGQEHQVIMVPEDAVIDHGIIEVPKEDVIKPEAKVQPAKNKRRRK